MAEIDFSFRPNQYEAEIERHAQWLDRRDHRLGKKFRDLFRDDPSAAVVELCTPKLLLEDGVEVEPGESPDTGGFEFACTTGEVAFDVEVTSIRVETVVEKLGVPETPKKPFPYSAVSVRLCEQTLKVDRKRKQLARAQRPLLLVVGTAHFMYTPVLTDPLLMEWMFCDPPHPCSVFSRMMPDGKLLVLETISAILFYAVSPERHTCNSALVSRGVICPNPRHEFQTEWLPLREFCEEYGFDTHGDPICRWFRGNPRRQIERPR